MPLSALREVEADYTVSIREMGDLLTRLAAGKGNRNVLRLKVQK